MPQCVQRRWLLMQVCTFDDNRPQILRCAICDAVRGTSLDYFMGHNAEVSSVAQHDAPDSTAKSGLRSKRAGSDGAGNKQKSILGFFAGFDAAPRGTGTGKLAAASPASVRRMDARAGEEQAEPEQIAQHASKGTLLSTLPSARCHMPEEASGPYPIQPCYAALAS